MPPKVVSRSLPEVISLLGFIMSVPLPFKAVREKTVKDIPRSAVSISLPHPFLFGPRSSGWCWSGPGICLGAQGTQWERGVEINQVCPPPLCCSSARNSFLSCFSLQLLQAWRKDTCSCIISCSSWDSPGSLSTWLCGSLFWEKVSTKFQH